MILATIPVLAGYLILGMAFGILLSDKGYSVWWALLMSTTICRIHAVCGSGFDQRRCSFSFRRYYDFAG